MDLEELALMAAVEIDNYILDRNHDSFNSASMLADRITLRQEDTPEKILALATAVKLFHEVATVPELEERIKSYSQELLDVEKLSPEKLEDLRYFCVQVSRNLNRYR